MASSQKGSTWLGGQLPQVKHLFLSLLHPLLSSQCPGHLGPFAPLIRLLCDRTLRDRSERGFVVSAPLLAASLLSVFGLGYMMLYDMSLLTAFSLVQLSLLTVFGLVQLSLLTAFGLVQLSLLAAFRLPAPRRLLLLHAQRFPSPSWLQNLRARLRTSRPLQETLAAATSAQTWFDALHKPVRQDPLRRKNTKSYKIVNTIKYLICFTSQL